MQTANWQQIPFKKIVSKKDIFVQKYDQKDNQLVTIAPITFTKGQHDCIASFVKIYLNTHHNRNKFKLLKCKYLKQNVWPDIRLKVMVPSLTAILTRTRSLSTQREEW